MHWNQPHLYSELHRYNLHKNLKASAGTAAPEKLIYKATNKALEEIPVAASYEIAEIVAGRFFQIDGLTSKDLMPYPHDPFREPALWRNYDHLTVRERLDQLDLRVQDKDIFETLVNSIGSAPGRDIGFTEFLRWYALSGHSLAQMFELAGVYKIGKGGMTSLARAMLSDSRCDLMFDTVITGISQSKSGVTLVSRDGKVLEAKKVVCTIPLNCLQDIKFTPALSFLKEAASKEGHINKGAKIHFKLLNTEPGWFAMCNGYGNSPFCFAFSDHNGTQHSEPQGTYCIAFGYNGHLVDEADCTRIIDQFKRFIKPDANVAGYLTHDWVNDPLSKGTWSCWGGGAMSEYLEELQKPHGNVVFASSDFAHGWRGFVDGAIESGRDAVGVVSRLLSKAQELPASRL